MARMICQVFFSTRITPSWAENRKAGPPRTTPNDYICAEVFRIGWLRGIIAFGKSSLRMGFAGRAGLKLAPTNESAISFGSDYTWRDL